MLEAPRSWSWKRWLMAGSIVVAVVLVGYGAYAGGRAWWAWQSIERVEFDLEQAAADVEEATGSTIAGPAELISDFDSVLVIGSDERSLNERSEQTETYADAVLLYLAPKDGGDPWLVSIPRDLQVMDPCTGEPTKIARTLEPCDNGVSDLNRVGLAVQQWTGVAIEDIAMLDLEGFVDVINAVGGIQLCSFYDTRDRYFALLKEGCHVYNGGRALQWVRSRRTQAFIDGEWQFLPGVDDTTRNERQQDVLLALFAELKSMRSPQDLTAVIEEVGDVVQLGEGFGLTEAIGLAWDLRSKPAKDIQRPRIPVEPGVLEDGSFTLVPQTTFRELIGQS